VERINCQLPQLFGPVKKNPTVLTMLTILRKANLPDPFNEVIHGQVNYNVGSLSWIFLFI